MIWEGSEVGPGARVHGALVGSHVRLGKNAVVGAGAVLGEGTVLPDYSRTA